MQLLTQFSLLLTFVCAFCAPLQSQDKNNEPIVIHHALGTTVIKKQPQRIATVGWANHEVPLALGVIPVGFAKVNFGDDNGDGMLPWVRDKLDQLKAAQPNAQMPVLFDESDGIDFEAIASTRPDVICAAYSGLSRSDYDTLSQIAPVVAYDSRPWATDWRTMIRLDSACMGMPEEGDTLIKNIEENITKVTSAHPAIKNKRVLFMAYLPATNLSTLSFYTANDMRSQFFYDLGMKLPHIALQTENNNSFFSSISAERIDMLEDVDIITAYGDEAFRQALKKNPILSKLSAISNNAIVLLPNSPLGTAASPTPLAIPWVLKSYVELLDNASRKSNGQ